MTLGDLIKKKDYDYISVRIDLPKEISGCDKEDDFFAGICCSRTGVLISKDGDTYSADDEILRFEEWESKEHKIRHGLTVVLPYKRL